MKGHSHALIGAAAAIAVGHFPGNDWLGLALTAGAGALGGVLPDIDSDESVRGASGLAHRGGTHSLLAVAGLVLAWHLLEARLGPLPFMFACVVGYVSHLAADALTLHRIKPLWPLQWRFGLPLISTGSLLEYLVVVAVGVWVAIRLGLVRWV